jgi:hypothetical protein
METERKDMDELALWARVNDDLLELLQREGGAESEQELTRAALQLCEAARDRVRARQVFGFGPGDREARRPSPPEAPPARRGWWHRGK